MNTTVYFVRHAQPDFNIHDDLTRPLTQKGMEDRKLATAFFSDINVDAVLSSPYKRAYDTVKHLADERGKTIHTVDGFRERKVENVWIEDFDGFCKMQWADFEYKLSDGECLREVQERNIAALNNVLNEYRGQTVVVGSHGTALSTIINFYDNSFGYEGFESIRRLMPWIVKFVFEDDKCIEIEKYNLFEQ